MSYIPGGTYGLQFSANNVSGILVNADALPLGHLFRNGLDDFTPTVFITNLDLGRYVASGTIPGTYNFTDSFGVVVSGYVNGILFKSEFNAGSLFAPVNLASGAFDSISIEAGVNARQAISVIAATIAGTSSGINNTIWYKGINNPTVNRVVGVAISGLRSAVSYIFPA